MRNGWVWGRAPATIANVGPGFDVFALAIHGPRDEVAIRPADKDSLAVEGVGAAGLPTKFSENTAGIVIDALPAARDSEFAGRPRNRDSGYPPEGRGHEASPPRPRAPPGRGREHRPCRDAGLGPLPRGRVPRGPMPRGPDC